MAVIHMADLDLSGRRVLIREDLNVPLAMGRYFERTLPHATLTVLPGEGHLSAINNHAEKILAELVGRS